MRVAAKTSTITKTEIVAATSTLFIVSLFALAALYFPVKSAGRFECQPPKNTEDPRCLELHALCKNITSGDTTMNVKTRDRLYMEYITECVN